MQASHGYQDTSITEKVIPKQLMLRFLDTATFELADNICVVKRVGQPAGAPDILLNPKSILILSIYLDKLLLGCLMLQNFDGTDAFDELDRSLMSRFYEHVSASLIKVRLMNALKNQNRQLGNATLTDQQTGLRNKRYIFQCLDSDIAMSFR